MMLATTFQVLRGILLAGLLHSMLVSWVLWTARNSVQQQEQQQLYSLALLLLLLPYSVASMILAYICVLDPSPLLASSRSTTDRLFTSRSASDTSSNHVEHSCSESTPTVPDLVVLVEPMNGNPKQAPAAATVQYPLHQQPSRMQQHHLMLHMPPEPAAVATVPAAITTTTNSSLGSNGSSNAADVGVDVWILAGQSNCVGSNGPDGQIMPEAAAPWPGKILAWSSKDCQWQDAVPNVHLHVYGYEDAYSCGPDMAFARTLIQLGVSSQVGLIPTALGATNLYDQWRPGGDLWCNMMQYTLAAMTALGHRARLKGIIWIQGESDAVNTAQEALNYGDNLTAWLKATRSALAAFHPQLPMVMAVMSTRRRHVAFPFIDAVRCQQQALQLPSLFKIDMEGYEFFEQDFYGHDQLIHLSKAGCCALGVAMAYAVALKIQQS